MNTDLLYLDPTLDLTGFYRSDPMISVTYEDGERREETYYLYYQFLDLGIWVSKTHDSALLNFPAFLRTIDFHLINSEPEHNEPLMSNNEFFYQCGRYTQNFDRIRLDWKNTLVEGKGRSWEFVIRANGRLETALGDYSFRLIHV